MKRVLTLVCCAGLLACKRSPSPAPVESPPSDPQVVAAWNGGRATLTDIEGALLSLDAGERLSREGDIVKTYGEVAREKALSQVLLAKGPSGAHAALETRDPDLYRQTLGQLYSRDVVLPGRDVDVREDEVKAFFRDNAKQFRRTPRMLLFNIFRRGSREDPGAAVAFLDSLRKRVQAGERFSELAREHSESETRASGGQVGWIERGAMAPELDRVAFSLKEGQVSAPVRVPSGAVLLYADKVVPEKTFAYKDVRVEIRRHLERKKLRDALEDWAKDVAIPEGSLVLSRPQLQSAFRAGGDDQPVLKLHGATLARGELVKTLPPSGRIRPDEAQLWENYRQRVRLHLLVAEARRDGFADRPETRAALERLLGRALERKAVEERLDARLKGDLAPQDATLRAYYDEHAERFMTPLKIRLRRLAIDRVPGAGRKMRELEAARQELVAGKLTLEDAARRLGGRVEEIGWREISQLEGLESKERRYVLDLESAGYTVPYQSEGSLRLIQVAERQEPAPRAYEQARADVLAAYLKEKRKDLLAAAADRVLADARFRFFDDRVRAALAVTTPKAAAPPAK